MRFFGFIVNCLLLAIASFFIENYGNNQSIDNIIAVLISVIASEAKQSLATGLLRLFVPRNDTLKIESRNSVSVRDNVII